MLKGGSGDDKLFGGRRRCIERRIGDDELRGGADDDVLRADPVTTSC